MREQEILKRIDVLLTTNAIGHEAFSAALGLLSSLYGPKSPQVDDLTEKGRSFRSRFSGAGLDNQLTSLAQGVLQNLKSEIESGLVASLQGSITGEVLTDFLQLARAALSGNRRRRQERGRGIGSGAIRRHTSSYRGAERITAH